MEIQIDDKDIDRIASRLINMLQGSIVTSKQPESKIMDVEELSTLLRVEKTWVYKQIQFKSIPHFHAGKYPRFKRMEIDNWITEQSMPSTCHPYPKLKPKTAQ